MAVEDRKARIELLDGRHLNINIQPKLMTSDLLHLVCAHYLLKDKELFGLVFTDEMGQHLWLQKERRVLEHDLPRATDTISLQFLVRLYAESITLLDDLKAVELYYLQAQLSVSQEVYTCDSATVFQLAAHVLQERCGDFTDDLTTRNELKKLPVIPMSTLKEHPSITYCEDEIIQCYRRLTGMSQQRALVNYMSIIESLPVYGVHFYEVKDKVGLPWWLGLSSKGVTVFDHNDRKNARKEFPWKQLENIYFRDRKFSIQVHDVNRSSKSLVRRHTLTGPTVFSGLAVHSWYVASAQLTKAVWSMAVEQHKFYIRMKNKVELCVRSVSDVVTDLCCSAAISNSAVDVHPKSMCEDFVASKSIQVDLLSALIERQELLQQRLTGKLQQLRQLCLQEAEMTGVLPSDYPSVEGEPTPVVRRRVGAMFMLSPKLVNRESQSKECAELMNLQIEVELQDKITSAALHLTRDKSCTRSIHKKRIESYQKAYDKLKQMEHKLCQYRTQQSFFKGQSSFEDVSEDSQEFIDSDVEANKSPAADRPSLTPTHIAAGYVSSAVYTTRTQYRLRTYPTLSVVGSPAAPSHVTASPTWRTTSHATDSLGSEQRGLDDTDSLSTADAISTVSLTDTTSTVSLTDTCLPMQNCSNRHLLSVNSDSSLSIRHNTPFCVEISKPFVSADVLIYSEKRRRNRQLVDPLTPPTDPAAEL